MTYLDKALLSLTAWTLVGMLIRAIIDAATTRDPREHR